MNKHIQSTTKKSIWKSNGAYAAYFVVGLLGLMGAIALTMLGTDSTASGKGSPAPLTGDVQEIRMTVTGSAYQPSMLSVQAGKPVRWLVDGSGAAGCTKYLVAPELGVSKSLSSGQNVIEFIAPSQKGSYGFSCSMGMVKGTMNVV